jgi:5-formyltetrahydrofolate cyclo-ligase
MGRGAGYYDRYLHGSNFLKVAVCREAVLQDRLPEEPHDEPVDIVMTENRLYDLRKMK